MSSTNEVSETIIQMVQITPRSEEAGPHTIWEPGTVRGIQQRAIMSDIFPLKLFVFLLQSRLRVVYFKFAVVILL